MNSNRVITNIDSLLLDPNNYRFIDKPDYKFVPDEQLSDPRVQQRTLNFLLGKNNDNIQDLISSITTNGFLDIDQIQVKAVGDKYLVLEGNRRSATLKYLYEEFKKGNDVGKLAANDFQSIKNIVCIEHEDPAQHLITMGLHHISGKKKWSTVNEAQLINDLLTKFHKTEEEVCNALGISKHTLRRNTRTLALIRQYKESDYGDQFKSTMYSIFESIVGSSIMKEWIEWDDYEYEALHTNNLQRLFSWISETEEIEIHNNEKEEIVKKEPIITQYRQIKDVASFIWDEQALLQMEEDRSINAGYIFSKVVGETKLKDAIDTIKSYTQIAYNFKELMDETDINELNKINTKIEELIPASKALIFMNEKKAARHFDTIASHFTTLQIEKYRKLENIKVVKLSKVNIFAGGNNKGKTSILEAVYLLSQLNDIPSYLELERFRGKFLSDFHSKWIEKNFINPITLDGEFNSTHTSLQIRKESTEENIERTGYLDTLISEASVGNQTLFSYIHLYANKAPQLHFTRSQILCRAAFTSPYRYSETLLHAAHKLAVENKYFDKVIEFINQYLDEDIEKIDLVNDEGENRFRVSTKKLDKAIDLTKYGEGLQRVFEIALLLGYCKDGILCVDEIDSAIHKSLLLNFTKFIQKTADDFNVQVFLSTHSKECIDAFVENDYPDDNLTAYALTEEEGKIVCKFLEGNKLKQLVESINLDIR
jgi:AAA15 family ATPase/GTPase